MRENIHSLDKRNMKGIANMYFKYFKESNRNSSPTPVVLSRDFQGENVAKFLFQFNTHTYA